MAKTDLSIRHIHYLIIRFTFTTKNTQQGLYAHSPHQFHMTSSTNYYILELS